MTFQLLRKLQQTTLSNGSDYSEPQQNYHGSRKQFSCNNNQSRNNQVSNTTHHNNNNNQRSCKNDKMSKNNNGHIKQTNVAARRKDPHQQRHHRHHHDQRRSQFNPVSDSFIYERSTDTHSISTEADSAQGLSSGASSDADDEDDITKSTYPSSRHNIRKRLQHVQQVTNINQNNYTELRPMRSTMARSSASTAAAPSAKCSGKRFYAMATSRFAQEDIVFTENQIYIGLKEMLNAQNSTATNRVNNKLVDKTPFNMVSNIDTQNHGIHKNYAKSFHDSGLSEQILFEKVKFDANKRYLQTSPVSTNSASSRIGDLMADPINYRSFLNDATSQPRTSSMYVNDERDTSFTQHWPTRRPDYADDHHHHQPRQGARRLRNEVPSAHNYNADAAWQQAYDNDNGYIEQNSVLDNHRNRIRSSSPSPPAMRSPSSVAANPLPTLDALLNNNYGPNGAYYYERASASSFSRRSSISTTETWVDDESFDNSFNEELEKRCEVVLFH